MTLLWPYMAHSWAGRKQGIIWIGCKTCDGFRILKFAIELSQNKRASTCGGCTCGCSACRCGAGCVQRVQTEIPCRARSVAHCASLAARLSRRWEIKMKKYEKHLVEEICTYGRTGSNRYGRAEHERVRTATQSAHQAQSPIGVSVHRHSELGHVDQRSRPGSMSRRTP